MNLILFLESDFIAPNRVQLTGRQLAHARDILKVKLGQTLTVGRTNGLIGKGQVVAMNEQSMDMDVQLDQKPPQALPLTLIMALPRPSMFKRVLFSAAMLGIKKIIVLNFSRVEKGLWNSSALKSQAMQEQMVLGLEQAKDTVMPEVVLEKYFKPFVQDQLPGLIKGTRAFAAHPGGVALSTPGVDKVTLVIGPEGGITDYEIQQLKAAGCQTVDLGPRIMRVETVLPYIVGKMF